MSMPEGVVAWWLRANRCHLPIKPPYPQSAPAIFSVKLPYVLLSDLKSEQQAPERHLLGHLWGNAALASPHQQL